MPDRNKDLLGRLADLSEEAIQRLADAPGADRALQALRRLGDRVDELQRRTRGFEELERRLSALERRVDALGKARAGASSSRARTRTAKSGAPPKKAG
ncbi:MAG TPA: hypothetical protein VE995_00890 [Gaiellaceae bacterium]|nr:hypothetical protein [Gaiellaceae bacterium]